MLAKLGFVQYRLAMGVPPRRINEIVRCRRANTANPLLRNGLAPGMTPVSSPLIQRLYDYDRTRCA